MDSIEQQIDDLDFLIYEQMYIEARTMKRKPQSEATVPGSIAVEGTPLDFSFLKLQDVKTLEKERPRAGKRIAIEKDDEEEEQKKAEAARQNDDKAGGELKDGKPGDIKVRNAAVPKVLDILQNNSISLMQQKQGPGATRKADDGNEVAERRKDLTFTRTALLLNNNELRDLYGLYNILETKVMRSPRNLTWLNLAYNQLVTIDAEILQFPFLRILQLHGNYIHDLSEVQKLDQLTHLYSMSLNGNPIEAVKGYRMYVLGIMYKRCETLKKLDSTVITGTEYDNMVVWNQRLFT